MHPVHAEPDAYSSTIAPWYLMRDVTAMVVAWESEHFRATPGMPDSRQLFLRLHLIQEELAELVEAMAEQDGIGMLDALGDLDVVVTGTWLALGLQGSRSTLEMDVSLPRESFCGPLSMKSLIMVTKLQAPLAGLAQAFADESVSSCLSNLHGLDMALTCAWAVLGMNDMRQEVSTEILRSNLSKLDPATGKVIKTAAGRVQKGPAYSKPDLKTILDRFFGSLYDDNDGEAPCCEDRSCPGADHS